MDDRFQIQFWGVRGTLPVPGKEAIRYGGNTNCVTLTFDSQLLIFDAGTGIKQLSNHMVQNNLFPISAKILITHPHYDHINGIPFFIPLYTKGNTFEFFGAHHNDISMEDLISAQMNTIYFPVTIKEFSADIKFRDIGEESFDIDGLHIQTLFLTHPGKCLGYRVQHANKTFCYLTDNELYLENSPLYNQKEVDRIIQFISHADLAVIDTTFSDEQYLNKIGWGHSCISRVVDVADKAEVKTLCLHHHNPDETDKDIDMKLKTAKLLLKARKSKTKCVAPHEGDIIII